MSVSNSTSFCSGPKRNGVFYVTDMGFLMPTIAGALALREKVSQQRADIRIIVTDLEEETTHRARGFLEPRGIFVDTLPKALFSSFNHALFNQTHVPTATLGRFFMLDCVPDIYDRILYLDGDTWPTGDPVALFDIDLPAGKIAAAEDQSFFYRHEIGDTGRRVRTYFEGLGVGINQGYFNAGVILSKASTWRTLSIAAFDFFRRHPDKCKYHDQSALNAVAGRDRIRLAPRWNFLNMYFQWNIDMRKTPEIIHFCGGDKPWKLPLHGFFQNYARAFAELALLGLSGDPQDLLDATTAKRSTVQQKLMANTIVHYRNLQRRRTFEWLTAQAVIQ